MRTPLTLIRALAVLACVFLVAPAVVGQTPVWKIQWDQPSASLAEAQGYFYSLRIDTQPSLPLAATCTDTVPIVTCAAPLPVLTSGPHTLVLTAMNAFGTASSAPLSGTPPLSPTTVTVIVTITVK